MLPFEDRFRTRMPEARKVHTGLDGGLFRLKGGLRLDKGRQQALFRRATAICRESESFSTLSAAALQAQFDVAQTVLRRSPKWQPEDVDRFLALIGEYAHRALGMRPYPVQFMGALVIEIGALAEMATGEGKSLTTGIAAVLMAATGKPVHVLSANDYLAARDAEEMTPLFHATGNSVESVVQDSPHPSRPALYKADIVYTTAKELLGDFLRDRLALGSKYGAIDRSVDHLMLGPEADLCQRGLHAVLVDEADSVLVDEAVTPLILSVPRPNPDLVEAVTVASEHADVFRPDRDFVIDKRHQDIRWLAAGVERLGVVAASFPRMWRGEERRQELMTLALHARYLLENGDHYVVQDGQIILLDVLTGRPMPDRNLGIGLHQALEHSEGLEISPPTETLARFSYQKFFRLIPHLAGMSGTISEARAELWQIYHLPIVTVPTWRPIQRRAQPWHISMKTAAKMEALAIEALDLQTRGHAVLVGTRTLGQSEELAQIVAQKGGDAAVLNADKLDEEADIVARAGQAGSLTIATNMAGRGTDIKISDAVRQAGGLHVLILEPQDTARADRQLFGRAGRQGDPGLTRMYVCPEDSLFQRFGFGILNSVICGLGRAWPGFTRLAVSSMQKRAERHGATRRRAILQGDDWYENYLSFPGAQQKGKN